MEFDLDLLNTYIEQGLIRKQVHPTFDIAVYCYTNKCSYDRAWDTYTTACRGLVLDNNGRVVARPFSKFFGVEEWLSMGHTLPSEPYEISIKYDGSMICASTYQGELLVNTRGSFDNMQVEFATAMLQRNRRWMLPQRTYVFELIHPENRIVLDYGHTQKLVLLACFETATGREIPLRDVDEFPFGRHVFLEMATFTGWQHGPQAIYDLAKADVRGEEGRVVRFRNGLRLKIKFEDYKRLHRLITGVSSRRIWEVMSEGGDIQTFLRDTPEEYREWVETQVKRFDGEFASYAMAAHFLEKAVRAREPQTQREFVALVRQLEDEKEIGDVVIFRYLNKHETANKVIWKKIRPAHEPGWSGGTT